MSVITEDIVSEHQAVAELGTPVQKVTFPISTSYVSGWTLDQAIAEAVSNAIDADPENFSYTYDAVNKEIIIEDFATDGIGAEAMVFGWSNKTDRNDVIGQFGEGLKIATIRSVSDAQIDYMIIESVGVVIVPTAQSHTSVFSASGSSGLNIPSRSTSKNSPQVLTWNLFPSTRPQGTRVRIGGASQALSDKVKARFRHLTSPGYSTTTTGEIVTDEASAGKIYIGGVYVKSNNKLNFGYDIPFEVAKRFQNRDRTIIEDYVLSGAVRDILQNGMTKDSLVFLIKAALEGKVHDGERSYLTDSRSVSYSYDRKMWAEATVEALGDSPDNFHYQDAFNIGNTTLSLSLQDSNSKELVANNMSSWEFNAFMKNLGVKTVKVAQEARNRAQKTLWVARSAMTKTQKDNLKEVVDGMKKLFGKGAVPQVKVFDTLSTDEVANASCSTLGYFKRSYGGNKHLIAIKQSVLDDKIQTWNTMYHEVAHFLASENLFGSYGEFADRTRGFENTLVEMGAVLAQALTTGKTLADLNVDASTEDSLVAGKGKTVLTKEEKLQDKKNRYSIASSMTWKDSKTGVNSTPESIYGEKVREIIDLALNKWASENGVDSKNAAKEFCAQNYVSEAVLRRWHSGVAPTKVEFEKVADICRLLNIPSGLIWWATVGMTRVWAGRSMFTERKIKFSPLLSKNAMAACDDIKKDGRFNFEANYLARIANNDKDALKELTWYSTDWFYYIGTMLDYAKQDFSY